MTDVSKKAAALAADNGVDTGAITGTGQGGQVTVRDVRAAIAAAPAAAPAADTSQPAPTGRRQRDPRKGTPLSYLPLPDWQHRRDASRGRVTPAVLSVLDRPDGATVADIMSVLDQDSVHGPATPCRANGASDQAAAQYARSWLAPSYVRDAYGYGLVSVAGPDGTTTSWLVRPAPDTVDGWSTSAPADVVQAYRAQHGRLDHTPPADRLAGAGAA